MRGLPLCAFCVLLVVGKTKVNSVQERSCEEKRDMDEKPTPFLFPAERSREILSAPREGVKPEQRTNKRKAVGVVLVIAVLFLGGAIYAWQGSLSDVSLGELTSDFTLFKGSDASLAVGENQALFGQVEDALDAGESDGEDLSQENGGDQQRFPAGSDEGQGARGAQERTSLFALPENDHFLRLLAPNGGETYCLGDQLNIQWEHRGVAAIQFYLQLVGGRLYDLGSFPAGPSVDGTTEEGLVVEPGGSGVAVLPEVGSDYIVTIVDVDSPSVTDTSNGTFSIVRCQE